MGMSTNVIGFKPPDEKWRQMKAVWDAATAADIEMPDEVERFFDGEPPDPAGVEIDQQTLEACGAVRDWKGDSSEGFDVVLAKVPADVKVIRFYNGR